MTAAIYAARSNLCPLVIAPSMGGQLMAKGVDVENYPGLPRENGGMMIQVMKHQARSFYAEVWDDHVIGVNTTARPFQMLGRGGEIIAATGANSKWLHVKGEWEFRGHGACAVIGGGDSAMEEALVLARICSSVDLLHRRDAFRASLVLQQRVLNHPNIRDSSKDDLVPMEAAFIAIGHDPNTRLFRGQVDMDEMLGRSSCLWFQCDCGTGYLQVTGSRTSVPGFFAAGDVADHVYRQAITSAGSGAMAALDAEKYLDENPVEEDTCVKQEDFQTWSLKDLREQVKLLGVNCVACREKQDFIASLQATF
eukprot:g28287.t1